MKKVILSLVFVLAMGTSLMNAKASNDEFIEVKTESLELFEDFGCASDCVKESKKKIKDAADTLGENSNDHIDDYMAEYTNCYKSNC